MVAGGCCHTVTILDVLRTSYPKKVLNSLDNGRRPLRIVGPDRKNLPGPVNNNHIMAKKQNQSTLSFRYALFSLMTGWLSSSSARVNLETLLPAALLAL